MNLAPPILNSSMYSNIFSHMEKIYVRDAVREDAPDVAGMIVLAWPVEEFLKIVDKADEEKPDLNEQLASQTLEDSSGKVCRIVAVTSCPTGIAHTYMAAEGLEKAARKKNCL